jgi:hypothetical protein
MIQESVTVGMRPEGMVAMMEKFDEEEVLWTVFCKMKMACC